MALETGTCAWCDGRLPPRQPRGRPRRYCSNACRQSAHRAKTGYIDWATSADVPLPDLSGPPASDTDEQAVLTLLEIRTLASVCLRLGVEARPKLAWRFCRLGKGIAALLDDLFLGDT
jgi:hypothetical protein